MQARTALVTGGSSGIGREVVRELAWRGAHVFTASRAGGQGASVAADLRRETGNPRVTFLPVDLTSLDDVHVLVAAVGERCDRLHLLLNHAGAYFGAHTLTSDGFEATFASHHLAHFLLTLELEPLLRAAGTPSDPARVVTTSSGAARLGRLDLGELGPAENMREGAPEIFRYSGIRAYARAKLANQLFALELAARWRDHPVASHVFHPGLVRTAIGPTSGVARLAWRTVQRLFGKSAREGAATALHLLCHPDAGAVSGRYWEDEEPRPPAWRARDAESRRLLWEKSLLWTGASDA